jgi:perosamine synthetase
MNDDSHLPAILGGRPVRPAGPPEWPPENPAVVESVRRALADGSWGKYHGPNVRELTQRLAELHGCEHVLLCASGTAAVELALRGLKVGPGDEVILAAYDFKGNFQDVLCVGATPVLVDVHPDNWNLDPAQLAAAVSSKTRAILVSHLHGGVVPMPQVRELADRHSLPIIEDACQMPGSRIAGRRAGLWGDVGVISFGGSKLLTAGRGGALFTPHAEVAQRVKLYTQRGNEAYPLSELQAAALLPQLDALDEAHRRRSAAVAWLLEHSQELAGLRPLRNCVADSQPGFYKVGWQYDAAEFAGLSRDRFAAAMRAEGIALDAGFRALHATHSARRYRKQGELPVATMADDGVLVLHHPVLLGTEADWRQILEAIEKIRHHAGQIAQRP